MTINIIKKEDNIIYFEMKDNYYEFNYDGLDVFIESFYSNKEEVIIKCDEEFNEYKQLLEKILEQCRSDDYVKAVKDAEESQKALDEMDAASKDESDLDEDLQ